MEQQTASQNNWLYLFIGFAVLVNFGGLFTPIIGPDGTLYAVIAKNMVQTGNYADLFNHGKDWLDKPHFPFWVTALSFKCFGFTTWAYKLPGILFLMMGAFYTYLFARNLYTKPIALWSVLILLTAEHIVLSNNDVRAEPYLTGLIIASVYHFYKADKTNSYWQLLAGCIFAACAVVTKGTFAIIPIAGAIAGHLIITRQLTRLLDARWLLAAVLILIFIIPEIWCLYRQFDLHPEKVIFGQTHVSGVKFFFWDSQFGRFFNSGPIRGHGDPSFFVHTLLWAFLPWSLLLFAAIFQFSKKGSKNVQSVEWYCLCGSLLTFLVFSASRFQLPHYLNIVFPFFAILTAQYLYNIKSAKTIRAIGITQTVIIVILLTVVVALECFFRPETLGWVTAIILIVLLGFLVLFPARSGTDVIPKIVFRTLLASFIVNIYLNLAFYPSLMKYQAGSEAATWINHNNPQHLPVKEFDDGYISAFEFYNTGAVSVFSEDTPLPPTPFLLYAPVNVIHQLAAKGWHVQTLNTFQRYWVSRLKPAFLNRKTRVKQLDTTAVARVN